MKKSIYLTLILATILSSNSCELLFPDDKFTLKRINNESGQLKLNGYYYSVSNTIVDDVYFFYYNGVIQIAPFNGSMTLSQVDSFYQSLIINNYISGSKPKNYWGTYRIKQNNIEFERYYVFNPGSAPSYIKSGKILNDTTFIITQSMRSNGKEKTETNETFRFRNFSPKPDSTNKWIK